MSDATDMIFLDMDDLVIVSSCGCNAGIPEAARARVGSMVGWKVRCSECHAAFRAAKAVKRMEPHIHPITNEEAREMDAPFPPEEGYDAE